MDDDCHLVKSVGPSQSVSVLEGTSFLVFLTFVLWTF